MDSEIGFNTKPTRVNLSRFGLAGDGVNLLALCNGALGKVPLSSHPSMNTKEKYGQFSVAGKQVVCPHCGGSTFTSQEILMNTRGATFVKLDFLNHAAAALVCSHCSHIEWFYDAPAQIGG